MRILLFLLPLLLPVTLSAQKGEAAIKADLKALAAHFQESARFDLDRDDRLVVDLFSNGQQVRRDMVPIIHLDTNAIAYNEEEQLVLLRCSGEQGQCIDKEVLKTGAISRTGRCGIPVPAGDVRGEKAVALLRQLVRDGLAAMPPKETGNKRH